MSTMGLVEVIGKTHFVMVCYDNECCGSLIHVA